MKSLSVCAAAAAIKVDLCIFNVHKEIELSLKNFSFANYGMHIVKIYLYMFAIIRILFVK